MNRLLCYAKAFGSGQGRGGAVGELGKLVGTEATGDVIEATAEHAPNVVVGVKVVPSVQQTTTTLSASASGLEITRETTTVLTESGVETSLPGRSNLKLDLRVSPAIDVENVFRDEPRGDEEPAYDG